MLHGFDDPYSVVRYPAYQFIITIKEMNIQFLLSMDQAKSMPYGILDQRLDENGRHFYFPGADFFIDRYGVLEIGKPDFFHFNISTDVVDELLQGNEIPSRMVEGIPDQLSKPTQIESRFVFVPEQYHLFDAVEAIEDKVWIHL